MLVRFRRGLDDDTGFINLISPCRTMDCILTNYSSIDFITAENLDVNSQYHVQFDGQASRGGVPLGHSGCYCYQIRYWGRLLKALLSASLAGYWCVWLLLHYESALCGGAPFAIRVFWPLYITVLQR